MSDAEVDARLAEAAARALDGDDHQADICWRGVRVSFHQVDGVGGVELGLSPDGRSHMRLPVPKAWIVPGAADQLRSAVTQAVISALDRGAQLAARANELAGALGHDQTTGTAQVPELAPRSVPGQAASVNGVGAIVGQAFPEPLRVRPTPGSPIPPSSTDAIGELPGMLPRPSHQHAR